MSVYVCYNDIVLDNTYMIHDRPPGSVIHYKQQNFVSH